MLQIETKTMRHLTIRTDEPMRVEIRTDAEGHLVVYGYAGIDDDLDQEPTILHDSHNVVEPL